MTTPKPFHVTVDLNRLEDATYMEVVTGTDGWARLEEYFRDATLVNLLNTIKNGTLSESLKAEVIHGLLKGLAPEELARVTSILQVSELLDTLIDSAKGHSSSGMN